MKSDSINIKAGDASRLSAAISTDWSDRTAIFGKVDQHSCFDEEKVNHLLMFLEDRFQKIGYLGSLFVEEEKRGTGVGRHLLDEFERKVSSKTDIDFLFARIETPQKNGLKLLELYGKRGFEPVKYSNGEMLMVNKGHAAEIKMEVFGIFRDFDNNNEEEFSY